MDTEIEDVKQEIRNVEQEIRNVEQEIRNVEQEIRNVEQQIRNVEQQIAHVEGQLSTAVKDADVAYWRKEKDRLGKTEDRLGKKEDRLRKKEDRLREEKLVLLKTSTLTSESPMTVETIKKLLDDAIAKIDRVVTAKSGISPLSMSSVTTDVADDILKMAGFSVVDGSAVDPAEKVFVSEDWKFDMGQYAREEDCYEPLFKHMVKYLNDVHAVNLRKDPPFPRGAGCCRLLDVHELNNALELEAELGDRTLRITGNLDAVFVPPRSGLMQYKDSSLGGVEVKHSTAHKETYKHGAPTVGTAKSGRSIIPGQALIEALAVYAYSDLPIGIFLFTSYDDNAVMELKDGEIWCWTKLNFAQAMVKIAAFLKGEDVRKFLENFEKSGRTRERPPISESKISVRKKLKIGLGNEEFLEQVDVVRSAAGSQGEMVSDLFQLIESWRSCRAEACGSVGPLTYFS